MDDFTRFEMEENITARPSSRGILRHASSIFTFPRPGPTHFKWMIELHHCIPGKSCRLASFDKKTTDGALARNLSPFCIDGDGAISWQRKILHQDPRLAAVLELQTHHPATRCSRDGSMDTGVGKLNAVQIGSCVLFRMRKVLRRKSVGEIWLASPHHDLDAAVLWRVRAGQVMRTSKSMEACIREIVGHHRLFLAVPRSRGPLRHGKGNAGCGKGLSLVRRADQRMYQIQEFLLRLRRDNESSK